MNGDVSFVNGAGSLPWRGGNDVGALYRVEEVDLTRLGRGMEKRLKVGDLVLCAAHSGDCFFDYLLVEEEGSDIKLRLGGPRIAAYALSGNPAILKQRDFHLLMAGLVLSVRLPMPEVESP